MHEFTLHDITEAMHSGRKIRNIDWPNHEYIYFKNGIWLDELEKHADGVFFAELQNWSYYEEPKKTEKRTFYRPCYYSYKEETIIHGPWQLQNNVVKNVEGREFIGYLEHEFEIPVEGES